MYPVLLLFRNILWILCCIKGISLIWGCGCSWGLVGVGDCKCFCIGKAMCGWLVISMQVMVNRRKLFRLTLIKVIRNKQCQKVYKITHHQNHRNWKVSMPMIVIYIWQTTQCKKIAKNTETYIKETNS